MRRDDDDSNKDITDQCFTLNTHQQQRLKGQAWTSKTWFKVKPGTSTTPPATAVPLSGNKGNHKERESDQKRVRQTQDHSSLSSSR